MGKIQGVVKTILALAILYTSMKINNLHCKRAVDNATAALANLTDRDRAHGKQFTKACCVCNMFVPYGEEKALTLERLKEYKDCFKGTAADRAKKTYKVKCYNTNDAPYRFLRHMMLSPRSYKVKVGNRQPTGRIGMLQDMFRTSDEIEEGSPDASYFCHFQWVVHRCTTKVLDGFERSGAHSCFPCSNQ